MAQHLYGVHDASGDWAGILRDGGVTGWTVISESIGDDPNDHSSADYTWLMSYGITPIVRLNYSHFGDGTIPLPDRYQYFAERCANFVAASTGCDHWLIANEPNLAGERYAGVPIMPEQYARCFKLCRDMIKGFDVAAQVMPAAVAPYNVDTGWCMDYWRQMLGQIAGHAQDAGADGLAIHCYSRGGDPASITSEDKMGAPYQVYYNGFRAYRDFLNLVPAVMRALPVFITETDQIDPWIDANSGWVQNAYAEINDWNHQAGEQRIHCLTLYRWEQADQWQFATKTGVHDDLRAAVAMRYPTPSSFGKPEPPPSGGSGGDSGGDALPYEWDERLDLRGCTLTPAPASEYAWRVTVGRWFDEHEAQGRTNIFVRVIDEDGLPMVGAPVIFFWGSGSDTKYTEHKRDPWLESMGLPAEYGVDFPMYATAPAYGVKIKEIGAASDVINGCGLGSIEQPNYAIHTAYYFEIQLVPVGETPEPEPPLPPLRTKLIWPVVGPVTQYFGDGGPQFGLPGHDGIDIACRQGTPVVAIADGEVVYIDEDRDYGLYVRIWHKQIYSYAFFAHLTSVDVYVGDTVEQGQTVAHSGNSGNSTGPHLHFELRGCDETGEYVNTTVGYPRGRYNPQDAYLVTGSPVEPA